MLKFLLIVFIISYAVYKLGGFFFKVLTLGGNATPQNQRQARPSKRPSGGNVDINYVPKNGEKDDFKGGEYVDFEEVK